MIVSEKSLQRRIKNARNISVVKRRGRPAPYHHAETDEANNFRLRRSEKTFSENALPNFMKSTNLQMSNLQINI